MADNYNVTLRIAVTKGKPETMVNSEETDFPGITFARMTHLSSEFYDLVAKLKKEKT